MYQCSCYESLKSKALAQHGHEQITKLRAKFAFAMLHYAPAGLAPQLLCSWTNVVCFHKNIHGPVLSWPAYPLLSRVYVASRYVYIYSDVRNHEDACLPSCLHMHNILRFVFVCFCLFVLLGHLGTQPENTKRLKSFSTALRRDEGSKGSRSRGFPSAFFKCS